MRKMKDSGIEWIGEIPEDWEVKRVKKLINSFFKGIGITKEEVFLDGDTPCVRYGEIYTKYNISFKECYSYTKKEILPSIRYFQHGDLLSSATGELVEEIGKTIAYMGNEKCLAGGDIIVLNHRQNPLFLSYAMNSHYIQAQRSSGKSKLKVVHVSASEIGNSLIAIPSLKEQLSIASYLDTKCSEIDSIVRNTEKTIEEYKKLKQSLITEVVTGKKRVAADGVSLSYEPRKMKDSGVEWIGEVPEEWGICKLKLLIKSMESGVSVNASQFPAEGKEFGVLKTSSVSKNYFIPSENKKVDADEYYRVSCPVKADTVIVSRMNTPEMVGAAAYCSENIDHIFLPDRLWQVSFVESTSAKFMWYFLISSYIKSYYSSLAMGTSSSMQNISQSQFSNANVLLPSLDEQQIISAYLDTKCSEIDKLIADKQTLLQELESYKKSLIYECVTGKREVK